MGEVARAYLGRQLGGCLLGRSSRTRRRCFACRQLPAGTQLLLYPHTPAQLSEKRRTVRQLPVVSFE